MLLYLGDSELCPNTLKVFIGTLTRFFSFRRRFRFQDPQHLQDDTYYWFLVLSAQILAKRSLSREMQARHTYFLAVMPTRLDEVKACDYM